MKLEINQIVKYSNGTSTIYEGKVMKIGANDHYTIIDTNDSASLELWNAGYAVGSYIHVSQVRN